MSYSHCRLDLQDSVNRTGTMHEHVLPHAGANPTCPSQWVHGGLISCPASGDYFRSLLR
jgi:hypothetical protein